MNRSLATTISVALLTLTACTSVESTSTTLKPLPVEGYKVEQIPQTTPPITSPVPTLSPSTQRIIFIANIESTIGGPVYDKGGAVDTGFMVCDALITGSSIEEVMMAALDSAVTDDQVLFLTALVASAISVFCPEMSYLVDQL